jgi:two-component system NtrC family sensor kinase
VLGRVIRNQIQRPLSKLLDGMHQVADLNLNYEVDVDATEDIKDMAITFNKMTQKLKGAQQELQQWSNTLEDKVKEKTRELEGAQRQMLFVEKMASMGKLAAVVAHEINNPMSGILTYSKLLIKNLQNNPSKQVIAESVENLRIIRDESKRCGDIIQNLLQFSKTTNGERANCDLKSIINKSIDLVEHKFEMKEVKIIEDLTTEDTTLLCDSTAIQQIVVSLLINAYEAFPQKGGEVKIGLYRDNEKSMFRLEVTDNGFGIPEDVLPRIFEPFYTTKDAEKNTGLGLAVVYGNVRRYGGSIDVKSQVNEGTTFIINMPIKSI